MAREVCAVTVLRTVWVLMLRRYGEDKVLTEGYEKDIWKFGY